MASILIADDLHLNRKLLIAVLEGDGHSLLEAANGAEALQITRAERPDLVITDLVMPTMDGYEFVHQLRADPEIAGIPVIFYTAHYLEAGARSLALSCGVSTILNKSAPAEEILRTVDEALGIAAGAQPAEISDEFDRAHVRIMTDKLAEKVDELTILARRQNTLIELCLTLASERDPSRLLEKHCHTARELMGARQSAVGVFEEDCSSFRYYFTSGSAEIAHSAPERFIDQQIINRITAEGHSIRLNDGPGLFNRASGPFLGVPIVSPTRIYGCLCLFGKVDSAQFSQEDERLAKIFSAQVGRIYENYRLYTLMEEHAARLEREVIERRRVEQDVLRLNRELEDRVVERTNQLQIANRELEAFAYSVSHDLQAPLRSIKGFSHALQEECASEIGQQGADYLRRICAASDRMNGLVHDLLDLSMVMRADINRREIDLSKIARAVAADLQSSQPGRPIDLRIADGLVTAGDPHLIEIVIQNLLGNAWKYTSKRVRATIEVGRIEDETFYVRDDGAGFDMNYSHKLFNAFQRLHSKSEFPGNGIGLAIVQRIISRHGGRIWAEAKPGAGAAFYFTFRQEKSEPLRERPLRPEAANEKSA